MSHIYVTHRFYDVGHLIKQLFQCFKKYHFFIDVLKGIFYNETMVFDMFMLW